MIISVECPACLKTHSVDLADNALEFDHSEPKGKNQMGEDAIYYLHREYKCDSCGKMWNAIKLVEYPTGRYEYASFE